MRALFCSAMPSEKSNVVGLIAYGLRDACVMFKFRFSNGITVQTPFYHKHLYKPLCRWASSVNINIVRFDTTMVTFENVEDATICYLRFFKEI